jgi:hypothetical protein
VRRRLASVIGILAASGLFLTTPLMAAHAQVPEPTSFCNMMVGAVPPVFCTLYEDDATGTPSEVSNAVALPPGVFVPPGFAALLQDPGVHDTGPKNWSDVVDFIPDCQGQPGCQIAGSVQFLSEGCGDAATNPFDITCFPSATQLSQPPTIETQQPASGTPNDFTDCTVFVYAPPSFNSQPFAQINACSDAHTLSDTGPDQPGPNIPEVPLAVMLPFVALGSVTVVALRRRRS